MRRRIYERETDALFARAFREDRRFSAHFIQMALPNCRSDPAQLVQQSRHAKHSGSIDLELKLQDGTRLLIENKIDAGYSVNQEGSPQPDRYRASIAAIRSQGINAISILLAPRRYIESSRYSSSFDRQIEYEALRKVFSGADLSLLDAAILQAETPYEPIPNIASATFFDEYANFCVRCFPELVLKRNPNGNGVRPTASRTIYFDAPKTLKIWPRLPKPKMSLQCWDSSAPSASVKIMLGDLAEKASAIPIPANLKQIDGYIRPAGRSLGFVIDTPRLNTQAPFDSQLPAIEEGLEAARRLASWWNSDGQRLNAYL